MNFIQNFIRWIVCKIHTLLSHNGKRNFANPCVISCHPPAQNFVNFKCIPHGSYVERWSYIELACSYTSPSIGRCTMKSEIRSAALISLGRVFADLISLSR